MPLTLIVAMTTNRVIGDNNQIPWHIPEELKLFKKITMGHPILMGRKTFESIGRPLPGRTNIVITRDPSYTAKGCDIYQAIDAAINAHPDETIFIIGGAEIFNQTIANADDIYLTLIKKEISGNRFFPEFDESLYDVIERQAFDGELPYELIHYRKRVDGH
ncbi:MAG: dihydrofolate reductase [Proteobacteria bacterium]|nr:dihydrofolate reductase [Pseudomonadota bacterium]